MHKAALKPDGGDISSTTLTKMKSKVWIEQLTLSLENPSHPRHNRRTVKTYHSFKLPISLLSSNEDNDVKPSYNLFEVPHRNAKIKFYINFI